MYMTPSEVFQRWGSVYEDKEKREFLEDMARGKTTSGFNMEGVMKYYNTGDNITYWDRRTGKVAVAGWGVEVDSAGRNYTLGVDSNAIKGLDLGSDTVLVEQPLYVDAVIEMTKNSILKFEFFVISITASTPAPPLKKPSNDKC